jgi:hypothetical protein
MQGDAELLAKLEKLAEYAQGAIANGLYEGAETIMLDAKHRTPVDTGNLRASGHVVPVDKERAIDTQGNVTFELGFGGPAGSGNLGGETNSPRTSGLTGRPHDGDVGYAVFVHETGPRAGGAGERKFLDHAIQAQQNQVLEQVTLWVNREIKKHGIT